MKKLQLLTIALLSVGFIYCSDNPSQQDVINKCTQNGKTIRECAKQTADGIKKCTQGGKTLRECLQEMLKSKA